MPELDRGEPDEILGYDLEASIVVVTSRKGLAGKTLLDGLYELSPR